MRRSDREVTDKEKIYDVISRCHCCRLGFFDDGEVYIVPLNFGYAELDNHLELYFHSAKEGRKISLIGKVDTVGFELDTDYGLHTSENPCSHSAKFQSVIGTGNISFVADKMEKERALQAIMYHNTKKADWKFDHKMLDTVCVFKVVVRQMSCKIHD